MKKLYDEQDQIDKVNIIRTELEINKANIEASKDAELRRFKTFLTRLNKASQNKLFFIEDNDLFDQNEISEDDRGFIMDIIDGTIFIADTKWFVQETEPAEMETAVKRKLEKQS